MASMPPILKHDPQSKLDRLQSVMSDKWDKIERMQVEVAAAGLFADAEVIAMTGKIAQAEAEYAALEVRERELLAECGLWR